MGGARVDRVLLVLALACVVGIIALFALGKRPSPKNVWLSTTDLSCGPASLVEACTVADPHRAAHLRSALAADPAAMRPATSLHDLAAWAEAAGFQPVGLRLQGSELSLLPLPAVVHLEPNHFVALIALDEAHALVIDQGSVQQQLPRETLESRFSGYVLSLVSQPRRAASPEG